VTAHGATAFESGFSFDHGEIDGGRQLNADGFALVKFYVDFELGHQVLDTVAENVAREVHLLEGLGIHEIVVLAVVVQIFHLLLIQRGAFHAVLGREPMLGHGAAAQAAHFNLHEAAQVAGSAVLHFEDGVEFLVELDYHARTELSRSDHELTLSLSVGRLAEEFRSENSEGGRAVWFIIDGAALSSNG
jgi:hypothetical protein